MSTTDAINIFLSDRNHEAFTILFKTFYRRLCRYFVLLKVDAILAEDLAQNVMLTVYQKAGGVRDNNNFEGWMFAVARNAMLTHRRNLLRRPSETLPLSEEILTHHQINPDHNIRFEQYLSYLKSDDRELMIRRYREGFSYDELSSALNIPIGTVKWRLSNIKKILQPIIQK